MLMPMHLCLMVYMYLIYYTNLNVTHGHYSSCNDTIINLMENNLKRRTEQNDQIFDKITP